jgi:hypothetical protein
MQDMMNTMTIMLPKPYISFSQLALFSQNKEQYRKQYYEQQYSGSSPELRYGSHVHKLYENNDPSVSHLPRYDIPEKRFEVTIEGIQVVGIIDSLSSFDLSFIDLKSGAKKWTEKKVTQHKQLPFYAMILSAIHEQYEYNSSILWVGTRKIYKQGWDGESYRSKKYDIELTGEWLKLDRVITRDDIMATKEWLVSTTMAISSDYAEYKGRTLSNI